MPEARPLVIVGAGPAGLMAADYLSSLGLEVELHDHMPSPARKFLMAGRGGLNLTHGEEKRIFLTRYGIKDNTITQAIERFPPPALLEWCEGLGEPTFIGSSGRVFPRSFKASPLLRALLRRLEARGVRLVTRSRFTGFTLEGELLFEQSGATQTVAASACLLALGGFTWPRLGSDGSWVDLLTARGLSIAPLKPFNAGVTVAWSAYLRETYAGTPLKPLALTVNGQRFRGEAVVTEMGLEGGALYAASAALAEALAGSQTAQILLDLAPDLAPEALAQRLSKVRKGQSQSSRLTKAGLKPVAVALLREAGPLPLEAQELAQRIKSLPLTVTGHATPERAISTLGGVHLAQLTDDFMVKAVPGLFLAGEMLDWQAPTGGYLLQACFATGMAAARGMADYLGVDQPPEKAMDWS